MESRKGLYMYVLELRVGVYLRDYHFLKEVGFIVTRKLSINYNVVGCKNLIFYLRSSVVDILSRQGFAARHLKNVSFVEFLHLLALWIWRILVQGTSLVTDADRVVLNRMEIKV